MKVVSSSSTAIRWKFPEMSQPRQNRGFTLMELMLGVLLSSLLMSGVVQLVVGSVSAYRLQLSLGQVEESARFVRDVLISHITQAGYRSTPWLDTSALSAVTNESLNRELRRGDQLGLQRWSDRNCYGDENSVTNDEGQARFYLLQSRFHINSSNNLAITCRYGPDASSLTTQINNYGLIENVESMQVLYSEDRDGDNIADSWVTAQMWQQESAVRSIKIALLHSSQHPFKLAASEEISLLDTSISTPADGHLRRVSLFTSAIRGRLH